MQEQPSINIPVTQILNVLDEKGIQEIHSQVITTPGYNLLNKVSLVEKDQVYYPSKLVELTQPFINQITEKVGRHLKTNLEIVFAKLHAQAHGQPGYWNQYESQGHIIENYVHVVYFPVCDWNPLYGGHTLLKVNEGEIHVIPPIENSLVIFPNVFQFACLEPTRLCKHYAFKLEIIYRIFETEFEKLDFAEDSNSKSFEDVIKKDKKKKKKKKKEKETIV